MVSPLALRFFQFLPGVSAGVCVSSDARSSIRRFLVVVWYVGTRQAERLLDNAPLQPLRGRLAFRFAPAPSFMYSRMYSGSLQLDEEIERVSVN